MTLNVCPTCNRRVRTPDEERESSPTTAQWNISFPSVAERDACKELVRQLREAKGVKGRVMAGPIVSEAIYGFLNGLGPGDWHES